MRKSIWDIQITRSFSLGELLAGVAALLVICGVAFGFNYFTSHAPIWAKRGKLILILLCMGAVLFGVLAVFLRGESLLYGGLVILYVIVCLTLYYYYDAIRQSLTLKLGAAGAVLLLLGLSVGAWHIGKRLP